MNIENLYPVRVLINPTDRTKKRAIMQEYEKVAGRLFEIEDAFYERLFADNEYSYLELYKLYSHLYLMVANSLERSKKLKAIAINMTYFHDMMCPMEEAKA